MANRDIITVGASAGGVETLTKLVAGLPADLPASVFIVQHVSPYAPSALARILADHGPLRVETATDHQEFQLRVIYVAPPDHHLMVDRSYMYITRGPHENHTRPAVDPLFRSAAVVHGPHVIGVVLSGVLDDGAAGLAAIKRCGGVAVVQQGRGLLCGHEQTAGLADALVLRGPRPAGNPAGDIADGSGDIPDRRGRHLASERDRGPGAADLRRMRWPLVADQRREDRPVPLSGRAFLYVQGIGIDLIGERGTLVVGGRADDGCACPHVESPR
jgi:chemotaxis response regulator CheB